MPRTKVNICYHLPVIHISFYWLHQVVVAHSLRLSFVMVPCRFKPFFCFLIIFTILSLRVAPLLQTRDPPVGSWPIYRLATFRVMRRSSPIWFLSPRHLRAPSLSFSNFHHNGRLVAAETVQLQAPPRFPVVNPPFHCLSVTGFPDRPDSGHCCPGRGGPTSSCRTRTVARAGSEKPR